MGRRPGKNFIAPAFRSRVRGKKTYYFFDTGGKPRKEIPLGCDFAIALRKWAELQGESKSIVTEVLTFRYVAERYMREISPKKSPATYKGNCREIINLYRFFDDPPVILDDIRPIHIRQYLDWRNKIAVNRVIEENVKRRAMSRAEIPVTGDEGKVRANREKALFSSIWNQARQWGYTDKTNPCEGVKGFQELGRDVYVEDDLYAKVYENGDQPLRDAMDLAYLTGQRVSDTLKISESAIKNNILHIHQGKTGVRIRIVIAGELEAVISRIRKGKQETNAVEKDSLIIDQQGNAVTYSMLRRRFDVAREKAGISKASFQFRDLRAKAGTDKAESAGDIRQAQRQLGHKNLSMTEHYVRNRKGDKVASTR